MAELRNEVTELRRELALIDTEKTATARRDLLTYMRNMSQEQLGELTNDVTPDVLDGMKKLVYSITRGMGAATVEPGVVLRQSGQAMAQLCMWQLVMGYNLRELEVRDQLQQQLLGPAADTANADPACFLPVFNQPTNQPPACSDDGRGSTHQTPTSLLPPPFFPYGRRTKPGRSLVGEASRFFLLSSWWSITPSFARG
ncbi:hypothetical protein CTAYLR_010795 [Chrysophaeum taylorii]|uniref:Uncharacterized protein n=1 Tax=Chrysophaeum taylorii TaxID=2483200 RepID=A0AAD7XI31_9STRA|nr:hypothetical protein CTAYLR_010795 [Chrysophaeum taylorii]